MEASADRDSHSLPGPAAAVVVVAEAVLRCIQRHCHHWLRVWKQAIDEREQVVSDMVVRGSEATADAHAAGQDHGGTHTHTETFSMSVMLKSQIDLMMGRKLGRIRMNILRQGNIIGTLPTPGCLWSWRGVISLLRRRHSLKLLPGATLRRNSRVN